MYQSFKDAKQSSGGGNGKAPVATQLVGKWIVEDYHNTKEFLITLGKNSGQFS